MRVLKLVVVGIFLMQGSCANNAESVNKSQDIQTRNNEVDYLQITDSACLALLPALYSAGKLDSCIYIIDQLEEHETLGDTFLFWKARIFYDLDNFEIAIHHLGEVEDQNAEHIMYYKMISYDALSFSDSTCKYYNKLIQIDSMYYASKYLSRFKCY